MVKLAKVSGMGRRVLVIAGDVRGRVTEYSSKWHMCTVKSRPRQKYFSLQIRELYKLFNVLNGIVCLIIKFHNVAFYD